MSDKVGIPDTIPTRYVGPNANLVPIKRFTRIPLGTDKRYPVGQIALLGGNPSTGNSGDLWYLAEFVAGVADWRVLSAAAGSVTDLRDQVNTLVSPTNQGFIDTDGSTVANAANPSGIPFETVGSTNTMTFQIQVGAAVTGAPGDKNDAGLLSLDDTIFAANADGYVTLATTGLATTITGDSGGALSPVANNWNIIGGIGIATSGSGATLTLDVVGSGFTWTVVTGATQGLVASNGYIGNRGTAITYTLPTTAAVGDITRVTNIGAGLPVIAQNASESINFSSSTTTVGVGGSLTAIDQFSTLELICVVANDTWNVIASTGNWTVV